MTTADLTDMGEGYPTDDAMLRRLYQAADAAFLSLCERFPQEVADAQTLIDLEPSMRGMVVRYSAVSDLYDFVWTGRFVGSVSGATVRGEVGS
jgi:hypothetical protein